MKKCKNCKKVPTINGNGICGICTLKDTLADYVNSNQAHDAVMNMPKDEISIEKQTFVERSNSL